MHRRNIIRGLLFAILALNLGLVCFAQQEIPAFKRIFPSYGQSDVDTKAAISIEFNSEMDKKSVEQTFHIFPNIEGNIKWDANTMKFIPEKPLLPSTSYFVSLSPNVKTASGIPIPLTYFIVFYNWRINNKRCCYWSNNTCSNPFCCCSIHWMHVSKHYHFS